MFIYRLNRGSASAKIKPAPIRGSAGCCFRGRHIWREGSFRARLAIAVMLPFIISGAFQGGFGIPLPGDSNIVQELLYWLRHRGA